MHSFFTALNSGPSWLKISFAFSSYREYSILDIQHDEGEDGAAGVITWRFKLNQPIAEPSTPRVDSTRDVYRVGSLSDLTYKIKQSQTEPLRAGVMTSFNSLKEVQDGFLCVFCL